MKASEFITEETSRGEWEMIARYSDPMPAGRTYPELKGSGSYEIYKFSINLANHKENYGDHPDRNQAMSFPYSDSDEEILDATEDMQGVKPETMANKGSKEIEDINTKSPVAKKKKNRYSV